MKTRYFMYSLSLLVLLSLIPLKVFAQGDPLIMLQSVANRMIASLKAHSTTLKENPSLVYSIAGRIVVPHADLAAMSRHVLPQATWNNASSAQKMQFEQAFTTTLIRTYASALAQYRDQTVKFYPVRGGYAGKRMLRVNSEITGSDGPPIHVSYDLILSGSEWKLFDMTVEGVSMLESFRAQFRDQLDKGNMAKLVQVLRAHNTGNS
jgi:phospholipid transport system substrate-binding protein